MHAKVICSIYWCRLSLLKPQTMPEKIESTGNETLYHSKGASNMRYLLVLFGTAISENDLNTAEKLLPYLKAEVSVYGDPIQRLGAYMVEALIAKLCQTGQRVYTRCRALRPCSISDIMDAVFPCFKYGYVAANGAIAQALKGYHRIHIIDFSIAADNGKQWVPLIQAFGARVRDGSLLHVCITGVVGSNSERTEVKTVGQRLCRLAEACNVPFEFHDMPILDLGGVDFGGQALAVNFAFGVKKSIVDEISKDGLLRMVKNLEPKVVTLVECELHCEESGVLSSMISEAWSYYSAFFEVVDVMLPKNSRERMNVEEYCLGAELVNVIACKGVEREERFDRWRPRLIRAGFGPCPLSSHVNSTIRSLLGYYSKNYRLVESNNVLYQGWLNRPFVASSAWH